ncbi:epsin-3 [Pseudophryne corroboree]|uniref:epsin-3 n=1 Tax=Pseudophryne corroboree TaxID=495146 RepID=UPI003081270D
MATSSIRRQVKNIVHNYTDAEVKVREATSNDPWGPSTTLMAEIAQMTHSAEVHPEVMVMVWRRLNDSGKNWRHVYKGLTLLDYLIKNGSNKVVQDCHENLIAVQTLKDFQFLDKDGKDYGINVREKAKQIVSLLKDEERVKQERAQAQTTRRRMSQVTSAIDSSHRLRYNEASDDSTLSPELEQVRPQSTGEEELQLQLALAMSREEAEKKIVPSAPDEKEDLQLQAALNQSKEEYEKEKQVHQGEISLIEKALMETHLSEDYDEQRAEKKKETHVSELIDIFGPSQSNTSNIWDYHDVSSLPLSSTTTSLFPTSGPTNHYANISSSSLPWDPVPHATQLRADHTSQSIIFSCDGPSSWQEPPVVKGPTSDPWGHNSSAATDLKSSSDITAENSFELDLFGDLVPPTKPSSDSLDFVAEDSLPDTNAKPRCNTPESFLEPAAISLINLESLVSHAATIKNKNPFYSGLRAPSPTNPFQYGDQKPSLNQMRAASPVPTSTGAPVPMQNACLLPTNSAESGINTLRTISPIPGFTVPSVTPLQMQLHNFPPSVSLYPSLNLPYPPVTALNQLPAPISQPMLPSPNSAHAANNPFL